MIEEVLATIDWVVMVPAFVGGMMFTWAAWALVPSVEVTVPRLELSWKLFIVMSIVAFAAFQIPLYLLRLLENRTVLHSPNGIVVFISVCLGAAFMHWYLQRRIDRKIDKENEDDDR